MIKKYLPTIIYLLVVTLFVIFFIDYILDWWFLWVIFGITIVYGIIKFGILKKENWKNLFSKENLIRDILGTIIVIMITISISLMSSHHNVSHILNKLSFILIIIFFIFKTVKETKDIAKNEKISKYLNNVAIIILISGIAFEDRTHTIKYILLFLGIICLIISYYLSGGFSKKDKNIEE